jgi:hypothetical protein
MSEDGKVTAQKRLPIGNDLTAARRRVRAARARRLAVTPEGTGTTTGACPSPRFANVARQAKSRVPARQCVL